MRKWTRPARRSVAVVNTSTGEILATEAVVADTPVSRFIGLQGRRLLPDGHGLVLLPNNAIHTLFMRLSIDAIFVGQSGKVLRVGRHLRPWRIGPIVPRALYCVELPAGKATTTRCGDSIELRQAGGAA